MTQTISSAAFSTVDFAQLANRVDGELAWDDISRALYASSASIVEIWPTAVLTPKHANDVVEAMKFCHEQHVPVTCRGAGSGVAGQSLGRGLIIDFSVHMNRVLEIDSAARQVRFEPGVVKDDLDAMLAKYGLFWPPDPSSSPWCTAGAMIANNSGGARSVRYGTARDYLLELDLVDYQGERFKLRPVEILPESRLAFAADATPTEKRLAGHAWQLLRSRREGLRANRPRATRCSSGYNVFQAVALDAPLPGDPDFDDRTPRPRNLPWPDADETGANVTGSPWILDMPRLFCGSEGSLAVLLAARVRVSALPRAIAGAAMSFESDERMAHAVVTLLRETRPGKLELLDRSFIDVAAKADPALAAGIPAKLKTMLIAEYYGDDAREAAQQVDACVNAMRAPSDDGAPLAFEATPAYDPATLDRLWRIRKIATPLLSRVKGDMKPTRWVEDSAVPPWELPRYIAGVKEIFRDLGFYGALFGHAGEGNLHVNPTANVKDESERERMRECARRAFELVRSLGGVISGEHGDGVMRTPYLRRMFGDAYDVMVEIKREWDPLWLMNPLTKVLRPDDDGTRAITTDLRMGEGYARHSVGGTLGRPEILEEIEKCHGCGKCRTYCPLMSVGKEEKHTARAKANLLRAVVAGRLDSNLLATAEFKENIDLCINCGQCLTECPTQVDIPGIAIAFREHVMAKASPPMAARLLAKPDRLGKAAMLAPRLVNGLLKTRVARRAAHVVAGLDERRTLPQFHKSQGLPPKAALRVPPDVKAPSEVVIFPGCWANYYDPDGERNALIRIFEALGATVHTPKLACCGISRITMGQSARTAKDLARNVEALLPFVERGAPIVFSAPSCLLASMRELPRIVRTENAARVSRACVDAHAMLRGIFSHADVRKQLRPLSQNLRKLAYHQPCHSKVSNVGAEPLKLMELIPESSVSNLDAGCCGLSGTFGMKTDNFDMSMQVGAKLFGRIADTAPDAVFTPCGVCQTQIMQGAPGQTIYHPLRLLYEALP